MRSPVPFPLVLSLLASTAVPVGAAEQVVALHGFCFRSPVPLSTPAKAGTDALLVAHPPEAQAGKELFSLTAVRFPLVVTHTKAGMTPAELREYVRSVFLAAAPRGGEPVRRRLLGAWVEGETYTTSIPAPSFGEVFVLRRRDGDSVVIGFKVRREWAAPGRDLITAITDSLREGEGSCGEASSHQRSGQRTRVAAPAHHGEHGPGALVEAEAIGLDPQPRFIRGQGVAVAWFRHPEAMEGWGDPPEAFHR